MMVDLKPKSLLSVNQTNFDTTTTLPNSKHVCLSFFQDLEAANAKVLGGTVDPKQVPALAEPAVRK
jgi:hypothetical protein